MFPVEDLAGTRALPSLQTSGEVWVTDARDLFGHNFVFQSSGCIVDTSKGNGCISSVLPHRLLLVPPSLLSILYWRDASHMTLERYDVESCGESLRKVQKSVRTKQIMCRSMEE